MNELKSSRDKLICILNCCRTAIFLLTNVAYETGRQSRADEFLPVLIYTVIVVNPDNLYSNAEYILYFFPF